MAAGSGDIELVHSGSCLYVDGKELYGKMNDMRSKAWQIGVYLYILDGKQYLRFDGETITSVSDDAYVPTSVISRGPSGGGVIHEGLNLLGSR